MATIFVVENLGMAATRHRGGQAMIPLQYLHGLRGLGHHAIFLEFAAADPATTAYFRQVIREEWDMAAAALVDEGTGRSLAGLDDKALARAAGEAAAVIQLAAHYRAEPWPVIGDVRPRILVEQDPGYTHIWAAAGDVTSIFGQHDLWYTVGANVGTPRSTIPTCGVPWRGLWNPVVLDLWRGEHAVERDRFTTIAGWRDYGYLEHEGQVLGPKAEEFRRFGQLPRLLGEGVELVLSADPTDPDRQWLAEQGWVLEDPGIVSTPTAYRAYVRHALGEFSCAKGGYVGTRSGWFSDRSSCFLAAGRPVVLQATGFEDVLPTGEGLFAVRSAEEAAEAVQRIRAEYERHSLAARAIAAEHFASDRILSQLLSDAGVEPSSGRSTSKR